MMPRAMFWQPAQVPEQVRGGDDPDAVVKTLIESFGRNADVPFAPVELTRQHVFALQQLAGTQPNSLFNGLVDLIAQHGKVQVWVGGS